MANAPLGTAAAEPKIPQAVKSTPPKTHARRGSGTEENSSKTTFDDALKAAGRSKEETGKSAGVDEAKSKTVPNGQTGINRLKTKKSDAHFKTLLAETKGEKAFITPSGAEGISAAVSENTELTGLTGKELTAAQESDDREARSAATFVEKTKRTAGKTDRLPLSFIDTDSARRESDDQDQRAGRKGRIRTALSAKNTESAADKSTSGRSTIVPFPGRKDLSSSARRVEVVDRRKEEALDEMPRMTRGKSARLPVDAESRHAAAEKSEGFADVIRGEIAETDIELSPRMEQRSTGRSAAAELARKLDAQAGSDIVRQVKVVLNRSEAGEVRINLRPDNLGRVRIRIRMEDNRLTGRIFVESAAAREAFKAALDGLQTKLVESGFGAADLELAWDDSYQGFEQQGQNSGGQNRSSGAVAREFDNMVPTTVVDEAADGRVNMVV